MRTKLNQNSEVDKYKPEKFENLSAHIKLIADKAGIGFSAYSIFSMRLYSNHIEIDLADFTLRLYDASGSTKSIRKFGNVWVEMKREVRAEYLKAISNIALEIYRFTAGKTFIEDKNEN